VSNASNLDDPRRAPRGWYKTADVNLAAYLYATKRLSYDHIELHQNQPEFFFQDSYRRAASLCAEYYRRDFRVSLKLIRQVRMTLLREIGKGGR
jgi:hypothetical protein